MRVTYDPTVDAMAIELREGEYDGSEDVAPGVSLELDAAGNVLAIEIIGVRALGIDPDKVAFERLGGGANGSGRILANAREAGEVA